MHKLIFDTNVLRTIIAHLETYKNILDNYKKNYAFCISIVTFTEIVRQLIDDNNQIEQLMNVFNDYKVSVEEFEKFICIKDEKFLYTKFKEMDINTRKEYFSNINDNYNDFLCIFFTLFLSIVLYALVQLLTNEPYSIENENKYINYLNQKFDVFANKFKDVYVNPQSIRIKDKFNALLYEELEQLNNNRLELNISKEKTLHIMSCIKNKKKIFDVHSKEADNIRKNFFDIYYENGIKLFFDSFSYTFQEYIKLLLKKIIISNGKLHANDIADCLILNSIKIDKDLLLTADENVKNFLKDKGLLNELIYKQMSLKL